MRRDACRQSSAAVSNRTSDNGRSQRNALVSHVTNCVKLKTVGTLSMHSGASQASCKRDEPAQRKMPRFCEYEVLYNWGSYLHDGEKRWGIQPSHDM
eukprot:5888426-Pyramimonas_sp.AAC.1